MKGTGEIVVMPNEHNSTFYSLIHQNGRLTKIPENLCDFQNTVTIDLAQNFIAVFDNISCVVHLNTLYLNNNKITKLSSKIFYELHYLRTVDVSHNNIVTLEPNVFSTASGTIFNASASQETLEELDVTNFYSPGFFCTRNFSNTSVKVINKSNFKIGAANITVGPGTVYSGSTTVSPFYNFTNIGTDFPDLDGIIKVSHEYRNYTFHCDCSIVPFLKEVSVPFIIEVMPFFAFQGLYCSSPEELNGLHIFKNFTPETLDLITCNIIDFCPWKCICTDYQNQERVVVNCTGAGYTVLPNEMPIGFWNNKQLEVVLAGNGIRNIQEREWLKRVEKISFANNPFEHLDASVIEKLPDEGEIDLSGLKLAYIPRNLQNKDLFNINFTDTTVICDCHNVWIGDWIRSYSADENLICIANGRSIFAEHVYARDLGCIDENSLKTFILIGSLVSGMFIMIITFLLLNYFRLELLVLKKRLFYERKAHTCTKLFISFDPEDEWVFHWVIRDRQRKHFHETIMERLTKNRLKYYIPCLDLELGTHVEAETSQKASECDTFIIILSEGYLQNETCRQEFGIIWKQYKANIHKNIILIEFDLRSKLGKTIDRRVMALLRFNRSLQFEASNDRVIDRLILKLGNIKPIPPRAQDVDVNARIRLRVNGYTERFGIGQRQDRNKGNHFDSLSDRGHNMQEQLDQIELKYTDKALEMNANSNNSLNLKKRNTNDIVRIGISPNYLTHQIKSGMEKRSEDNDCKKNAVLGDQFTVTSPQNRMSLATNYLEKVKISTHGCYRPNTKTETGPKLERFSRRFAAPANVKFTVNAKGVFGLGSTYEREGTVENSRPSKREALDYQVEQNLGIIINKKQLETKSESKTQSRTVFASSQNTSPEMKRSASEAALIRLNNETTIGISHSGNKRPFKRSFTPINV